MAFITKNDEFICSHCGEYNPPAKKTCRNHCKKCLHSKHVDDAFPGDRKSTCLGEMVPIAVHSHPKHDWVIIHKCTLCGKQISNKVASDDDMNAVHNIAEGIVKKDVFGE